MAGRVEGKVAFITGAARGQGRNHAIRLAEQGADIIAVDLCADVETVPYGGATRDDLEATVKAVEALDRRIVATIADVRDLTALTAAVDDGVAQLGHVDIVSANAGISSICPAAEMTELTWRTMIDINLTGAFFTARAAIPHLLRQGTGGSIIITSSTAGLKGMPNVSHYAAAKHGLVGMARSLAIELGHQSIRVNTIHPTNVDTDMIQNEATRRLFYGRAGVTRDEFAKPARSMHLLPIPWLDVDDVTNMVLFLASDESRHITGSAFPIDGGATTK
ncbi:MAG: Oxidoreductase, family [Frankiales bacterium]|nr:Oxidoreductase, family [Frankiales bacterium]